MKILAALAGLAVLAGCAAPRNSAETVGNASNFQLCRAIFLAPQDVAQIARGEAERRSLDCAPYAQAVFQNEAQANAARSALAQQLLARPIYQPTPLVPYQVPTRPQINCNSYRLGNSVQTDCR